MVMILGAREWQNLLSRESSRRQGRAYSIPWMSLARW